MPEPSPSTEVERLRQQLLEFVAGEIGEKVASDPELPLSQALIKAIDSKVGESVAAQTQKLEALDAEKLARLIVAAVREELTRKFGSATAKKRAELEAAAREGDQDAGGKEDQTPGGGAVPTESEPILKAPWNYVLIVAVCLLIGFGAGYWVRFSQTMPPTTMPTPLPTSAADPVNDPAPDDTGKTEAEQNKTDDAFGLVASPTPTPTPTRAPAPRPTSTPARPARDRTHPAAHATPPVPTGQNTTSAGSVPGGG